MAERRRGRASVRLRTTAGAVLVVAVALLVGAVVLVAMVRGSLRAGVEAAAAQQVSALSDQVERSGLPETDGEPEADDVDDLEETVWQVSGRGGVLRTSQPLAEPLPTEDAASVRLRGADHLYVVVTEEAELDDEEVVVSLAASLEEVDDSTAALVTPLAVGLPLLLLLVGGTTWLVTGRALAPVERIRREVEEIGGDRLDRRVPEPPSRDEIQRLARTMNEMLGRLEDSHDRQRQFVADASHELRSPLSTIRQTAEVARAHPGALPEGELAEAVLEESARLQRLVEQMLVLTRADGGATARATHDVDLDDLVLAEARRVARTGTGVDTSGVGAARVVGDPVALAQVVRNLVDNAVRHARSSVSLGLRESGADVVLVVEDDGPGVAPDQRERVFERFVRLDEARARDAGGSGLGLAIVRSLVTAHGGAVTLSVADHGGARFVVRLPAGRDLGT